MQLTKDIIRIGNALRNRMDKGWLDGEPASVTVRPLMNRRRCYMVSYRNADGRQRWLVDAAESGIVLRDPGKHREFSARADVLVAGVMRLLKTRITENVLRSELARLQESATFEGFDFQTIYEVAARQCVGFHVDLETLMSEEPRSLAA
jgi:hypothetical protein